MNDRLVEQMEKGERDRRQAGADLAERTAVENENVKRATGGELAMDSDRVAMSVAFGTGWSVRPYGTTAPGSGLKSYEWVAWFTGQVETGYEDTWAEAMGAAKKAYHYLEDHSPKPE